MELSQIPQVSRGMIKVAETMLQALGENTCRDV